jgi:phage terminase large subunit-like protein
MNREQNTNPEDQARIAQAGTQQAGPEGVAALHRMVQGVASGPPRAGKTWIMDEMKLRGFEVEPGGVVI